MNVKLDLVLLVGLAAPAAAMPALRQDVAATVGPANSGTHGAASVPDFSGSWSPSPLNGLELPRPGPGPLRNRARLRPGPQAGVGNLAQLVGDYINPIL